MGRNGAEKDGILRGPTGHVQVSTDRGVGDVAAGMGTVLRVLQ